MPRAHTPFSNPHVHAAHKLTTPYPPRRQRSSTPSSPMSSSDKENASPAERPDATQRVVATQLALRKKLGENADSQYYDPFQSKAKVKEVTQQYRRLLQDTNECRTEFVKPGNNGILKTVEEADDIFERDVRTTGVANLDSRLLVTASDLAKQKARNIQLGDAAFNVDEYITKLVDFMGGRHLVDGMHDRDHDDSMDWAKLGRLAMGICRRPPTMGFILGPLSVEKKARKVTRRQAEKLTNLTVVRPQELKEGDIPQQENATDRLVRSVGQLLRQRSPINLFEFVINPRSFGQTIENIFYLSFNVRDARARIELDASGMPMVSYVETLSEEERTIENKQCVLEMTMHQWEQLTRAFNIAEAVIPHREDEIQMATAQTWY